MRTTLTLDDDVARELRRLERGSRRSFKGLVNDLLRKGLGAGAKPLPPKERFIVPARAAGFKPGIDPLKLNQLVDEAETERFLERAREESGS